MEEGIDTTNRQMVGTQNGKVRVLFPKTEMTYEEAMTFAAWLVVVAPAVKPRPSAPDFVHFLAAVEST